MTELLILVPAAVLLVSGIWVVRKESGDLSRAVGIVAIILGLLLIVLATLLAFLTTATVS